MCLIEGGDKEEEENVFLVHQSSPTEKEESADTSSPTAAATCIHMRHSIYSLSCQADHSAEPCLWTIQGWQATSCTGKGGKREQQ